MEIVTENATSLAWIGDAVMSLAVRESPSKFRVSQGPCSSEEKRCNL